MKRTIPYILAGVLLSTLALYLLISKGLEPPPLEFNDIKGVPVYSPAVSIPDLTFSDHDGKAFQTSQLKGHWSLMFFGYTHCPDICPTTLAVMNRVEAQLNEPSPDKTGYYFVTLDPKRDTPEILKQYVTYFNPTFIGLTGEQPAINTLSEALGIIYEYDGDMASGQYAVNHYSAILVIDPQARVRAHILPPHTADRITEAYSRIRNHYD